MRENRLTTPKTTAVYRVVLRRLDATEAFSSASKDQLVSILEGVSKAHLVEVLFYAIIKSELHMIVRVPPAATSAQLSAAQACYLQSLLKGAETARLLLAGQSHEWPKMRKKYQGELLNFRKRICSLSDFCKIVGQRYSVWHSTVEGTKGKFWKDRFQSYLIENTSAEIKNNVEQIEAAMRKDGFPPNSYKWCSKSTPVKPPQLRIAKIPQLKPTKAIKVIRVKNQEGPFELNAKQKKQLKQVLTTTSPSDHGLPIGSLSRPWQVRSVRLWCGKTFGNSPHSSVVRELMIDWKLAREVPHFRTPKKQKKR